MSAPVDVLAVLDYTAEVIESGYPTRAQQVGEARAAVAELIHAAAAVEKLATLHDGDDRMFDRLHAALARVGGAK